jgi:DNA polymerase III alpha subunit
MEFVHLHTHSHYSFHAGVPSVEDLVSRAKELGMRSLALTDTDRMSGLIRHYEECRRVGLKPLLGVELTEHTDPSASGTGAESSSRIDGAAVAGRERLVLLARNACGYSELCDIITQRHLDGESFSFETLFAQSWENVIIMTPWPRLLSLVAAGPNRSRLYGELVSNSAATRQRSTALAALAERLDLPLVATNDSFFLDTEDFDTHRILTAIGLNASVSRLESAELASPQATLRSAGEMAQAFADRPEALANAMLIADQCDVELDLGHWILPQVSVPASYTPESYLAELAHRGLEGRYGRAPSATRQRACELQAMELDVIAKLGYASYFLMVKEIRDWGNGRFKSRFRQPQDCTILRGSAANSITFYNIGVSDLDPIRYDLYFQRFLNEDRASPPDADLDFGWDERDEVFGFMTERWGIDCVAVTCTTNHFRERAAFRETAKVFGYTEEQITKILESRKTRTKQIDDAEIRRLWQLAGTIRGKPRFLGQHPGGVLITNDPIRRHVACEYSGGDKSRIITQVDMHSGIDELGLIKFDILGNGSLSLLRDTLSQLEEGGLEDPEVWDLEKCYADERVKDLIRTGRTAIRPDG